MSSTASRRLRAVFCSSALLFAGPVFAQTCDYKIVSASWSPAGHPDSIVVNFSADVDGPAGPDALNPVQYDMNIAIRFNGSPMEPDHDLHLSWWHGITCTTGCPPNTCEEKAWTYKGGEVRDQSRCTLNAQSVCGCPRVGDPVIEHKVVPKPPVPGTIEVEIIPLSLSSCNPINPGNDKKQIPYSPSGGSSVPGWPAAGAAWLAGLLAVSGAIAMSRRAARGGA